MPKAGDSFIVELKKTHISWGTYRYTNTRDFIPGETYIPVPQRHAEAYDIYNSNKLGYDEFGINLYKFTSYIGSNIYSTGVLKAQGGRKAGSIYAKNLSGNDDLKMLSPWIYAAGITVGDSIEIKFTSPEDIELRKI